MVEKHQTSRVRRGLGNGLGSLIPTPSTSAETRAASLGDSLFPSTGATGSSAVSPSGSKRVQRSKQNDVSRETSTFSTPRTAALQTAKRSERATSKAVDALMSATLGVSRQRSEGVELVEVPGAQFAQLSTAEIVPNSRQPREVFAEDELRELAASIQEVGVLQPIIVRPLRRATYEKGEHATALADKPEVRYELIMGERRLRASQLAGLKSVPAIIRNTEDDDLLRDALLENLHRVQLNPLEEASAYQQLMADFGATQEQLSQKIARSRSQIANTIRLLNLPPGVQAHLAAGRLSAGHARALLGFEQAEDMEYLAQRIVAEGLSVRTTEELVRLRTPRHQVGATGPRVKEVSPYAQSVSTRLEQAFHTKVSVKEGRKKGKIIIEFADQKDLERLAGLLLK